MIAGLTIAATGIILVPILNNLYLLLSLTFASLGLGIFYLASMAYLNDTVPNDLKGTISGAYYLFWGIGMFFGPPILTKVAEFSTMNFPLIFYAIVSLVIALAMTIILENKKL